MSKKILIIRLGAIGDVVHSSVIQQAIKEKHPDAVIHFLTSSLCAPLLCNDKNLEKVHVFDSSKKNNYFYLFKLGLIFRKERFDAVINLSNSIRNNFILAVANPKKVVLRSKNRVHAVDAFYNSAKEVFEDLEKPKNLKLYLSENATSSIDDKIKDYSRPFFIVNPGGENDNNRQGRIWPLQYWEDLSNKLIETYGGTVFVVGSKAEREYHKKIANVSNIIFFTGELSIEESAALFAKADIFVSGDSGPLHMADALGVKTIGIMGSTPALASGPYSELGYSISPTYQCDTGCDRICTKLENDIYAPCIKSITPDMILELIKNKEIL